MQLLVARQRVEVSALAAATCGAHECTIVGELHEFTVVAQDKLRAASTVASAVGSACSGHCCFGRLGCLLLFLLDLQATATRDRDEVLVRVSVRVALGPAAEPFDDLAARMLTAFARRPRTIGTLLNGRIELQHFHHMAHFAQ
jgi:hypothetical protein